MPYFTTEELRALPDMDDDELYPDARLEAAHDWIVAIIERECDTTFVPTEVTETLTGSGCDALFLSSAYIDSIDAVTVDGVPLTEPEVAALLIQHGAVYYPTGAYWSAGTRGNVVVTYTAGYPGGVPGDLKEAALRAARNWVLTTAAWSATDTRATAINNQDGNIQLTIAGPDRPTGLPDVDTTIMAWARRVRVPKVS